VDAWEVVNLTKARNSTRVVVRAAIGNKPVSIGAAIIAQSATLVSNDNHDSD
jgi:hypothetical protein